MARPASRPTDPKPTDASSVSRAHATRGASLLVACALAAAPAALAQPLPSAAPEKVGMSSERLARIGKALNQDIEQGKLPGAVVLVARKGKVVYFDAFGFLDKPAGKRMPKTPSSASTR